MPFPEAPWLRKADTGYREYGSQHRTRFSERLYQEKKAEYGIAWHMISYSSCMHLGMCTLTHIYLVPPLHTIPSYTKVNKIQYTPHKSSLDLCFQLNSHVYVVCASVVSICICYLNCFKKLSVIFVKCFSVLCFRPKPW